MSGTGSPVVNRLSPGKNEKEYRLRPPGECKATEARTHPVGAIHKSLFKSGSVEGFLISDHPKH